MKNRETELKRDIRELRIEKLILFVESLQWLLPFLFIYLFIYLLIFHYTSWLFIVVVLVVTKLSLSIYVLFCTPVVDAWLHRLLN